MAALQNDAGAARRCLENLAEDSLGSGDMYLFVVRDQGDSPTNGHAYRCVTNGRAISQSCR
jgi:hypothetical protein